MADQQTPGTPGEEPTGLAGAGGGSPPGGSPQDQATGQGSEDGWSPETQDMMRVLREKQKEDIGQMREDLVAPMQDEIDRLRADNARLAAPPPAASDVAESEVALFDKMAKSSPLFQGVVDQNRSLRKQVRSTAVDASLADLKGDPHFDKVAPEVKRLFRGISDDSQVEVTSEMVGDTYRARAFPLAQKENADLRSQIAELRNAERDALGNANLGSGSDASGGEGPPDVGAMSDEEFAQFKATVDTPENNAKFLRGEG